MKNKVLLWLAMSIAVLVLRSAIFRNELSPSQELTAYPFIILGLCLAFGWLKKDAILAQVNEETVFSEPAYLVTGIFITALSLIIPLSGDPAFMVFSVFLTLIGVLLIFFGVVAYIPSLLLFVYGFSISFPIIIDELLGTEYALATTYLVAKVAGLVYPVGFQGQLIGIINSQGVQDLIFIDAQCSGSASMAIFITIFALMVIDIRPRGNYAFLLFFFGILGTSLQNIFRLVLLLAANYHFGSEVMWQVHAYAGYVLFPVWFSIFVYVYLKVAIAEREDIHGISSKDQGSSPEKL